VSVLVCTVRNCGQALTRSDQRLICTNGHSFDVARSGYINLLQPQDRRSKSPGDTPEAVAARRRFLERGFAEPLVRAIVDALPLTSDDALLDVGCGEGHHLAAFKRAYGVDAHGVDLSVPAIDLAARTYRDCTWIVANADRFLPYADGSLTAVATITARLNPDEFRRVLAPSGTLLAVVPGAEDLVELREQILGERVERDRADRTVDMFAPRFTLLRRERIAHVARLDHDAIVDVMSSSYRGLRTRERERLEAIRFADVTLARDVLVLRPA